MIAEAGKKTGLAKSNLTAPMRLHRSERLTE
jgi:hypothetical protein